MNKIPDPHTFTAPQTTTPQKKKPTPKEREEKRLQWGVSALELIIGITVAALALLSGYWTFEGTVLYFERSIGLTFNAMIISALLAIAVTLAIVVLWWAILFVIPRSRTVKGMLLGLAIALTVQGWTLIVSSAFNAINLTSAAAIISTLDDKKGEYTIAVSATLERALKLKESLPGLKGSAKSWCTKAESEKFEGGITGEEGEGAVSGELDGICEFAKEIADTAQTIVETLEDRSNEAQALLSAADAVLVDRSKSVFERETAFMSLSVGLDAWLRLTKSDDFTNGLVVSARTMEASVAGSTTAAGSFGKRQQNAIDGFKDSMARTVAVYEGVKRDLDAVAIPDVAPTRRVDIVGVTLEKAPESLPLIATAIGIDCTQFLAMLLLMLAHNFVTPTKLRK